VDFSVAGRASTMSSSSPVQGDPPAPQSVDDIDEQVRNARQNHLRFRNMPARDQLRRIMCLPDVFDALMLISVLLMCLMVLPVCSGKSSPRMAVLTGG
jgi:hypothetical protein